MQIITAEDIRRNVTPAAMIEALREGFLQEIEAPLRGNHRITKANGEEDVLLTMPAWGRSGYGCVKLVNIVPGNGGRGLASVQSSVLLFSVDTGEHLAMIDGAELTRFRTACASALAAGYLARPDAASLLVVGAGDVGSQIPRAYRAVRDITHVRLWNRKRASSERLAVHFRDQGFAVEVAHDLEEAAKISDVISCATLATEPLIRGDWLRPGQHLDLIGSFLPSMREADDAAVAKSTVFLDTEAARAESGDILTPLENGTLALEDIEGDLFDLCCGRHPGRRDPAQITFFKSVGTAVEDLAAAQGIFAACNR
ncbi:ornithine cyclodeaminase family protein [Ruegeria pomeroyi]|nr:ornithine cyclodeaminase family protein [Ruegeria pomeroyi]